MASFTVSPGVTTNEIDQTFLTGQPVQAGAAIIGPTVKGPYEIPTVVTSYSQYVSLFGDTFISGGINYSYLTSISAYNYFNYGGSSLLVARVASGSFTSATSSLPNTVIASPGNTSSISINVSTIFTGSAISDFIAFQFKSSDNDWWIAPNSLDINVNGNSLDYYYTSSGATTNDNYDNYISAVVSTINDPENDFKNVLKITASYSSPTLTIKAINGGNSLNGLEIRKNAYIQFDGTLVGSLTGGTSNITSTAFTLETLSEGIIMNNSGPETNGALASGSKDNVRIEITNSNTSSGIFNVLVRQGNDTLNKKNILESFNGVNLDPNSPRFISQVIGDQALEYNPVNAQMELSGEYRNNSKYIRVKNINYPTPNYLDSNGNISNGLYPTYLPINSSSSFSSATGTLSANVGTTMYDNIGVNTQGLIGSDYDNMINLFGNQEAYQFNTLFTPGLLKEHHSSQISQIITNTQNRGDNLYVVDLVDYSKTVLPTITQALSINSSYATSYWPWVRIFDPATGKQVWVPASTVIPGVYAFNDKVAAPWFAPAGMNRGGLSTVLQAKFKLTQSDKDALYSNNINPLATLPKKGVVVFGQKTLQKEQSALDRVNVRRLLIELKNYIRQIADTVLFEQNTIATRTSFVGRVTPFLESIQQKQGLYAYKIIMDESNNGPAVIDQNQLIGQIFIQPTRTAEFISVDFILLPTGVEFPV
jgi:hypothetical protein